MPMAGVSRFLGDHSQQLKIVKSTTTMPVHVPVVYPSNIKGQQAKNLFASATVFFATIAVPSTVLGSICSEGVPRSLKIVFLSTINRTVITIQEAVRFHPGDRSAGAARSPCFQHPESWSKTVRLPATETESTILELIAFTKIVFFG